LHVARVACHAHVGSIPLKAAFGSLVALDCVRHENELDYAFARLKFQSLVLGRVQQKHLKTNRPEK
jgi:hypothetical protein